MQLTDASTIVSESKNSRVEALNRYGAEDSLVTRRGDCYGRRGGRSLGLPKAEAWSGYETSDRHVVYILIAM